MTLIEAYLLGVATPFLLTAAFFVIVAALMLTKDVPATKAPFHRASNRQSPASRGQDLPQSNHGAS